MGVKGKGAFFLLLDLSTYERSDLNSKVLKADTLISENCIPPPDAPNSYLCELNEFGR